MTDLLGSEREVDEAGGVRVGGRYRLTRDELASYKAAGLSAEWTAQRALPDRVVRIVKSDRYGWVSVFLERGGVYGPDQLEPAP